MFHSDQSQCFLFDDTDVRGEMVDLERSYSGALTKHPYPGPVVQLLREMFAVASLLCNTLRFDGLLVLQARSNGVVPLLMMKCSSDRRARDLTRYPVESTGVDADMQELMPGGVLTLTVDSVKGQYYQGVATLEGVSLAECLSSYFTNPEQLLTRLRLNTSGRRAHGLLLQRPPADCLKGPEAHEASWQHPTTLVDTLTAEELLALNNETVLYHLCHKKTVCLFRPQPLVLHYSCLRERSTNALVSLGQADYERLLEKGGGSITIDCQFCNQYCLFDVFDVAQLFAGAGSQGPSETRH